MSAPEIHESGLSTRTYEFVAPGRQLDDNVLRNLRSAIQSIEQLIGYFEMPNGSTHTGALPLDPFVHQLTLTPVFGLRISYKLIGKPMGSSNDRQVNTSNLKHIIDCPALLPIVLAAKVKPSRPMVNYLTLTTPSLSDMGDLLGRVIDAVKRLAKKLVRK